MGYVGIERDDLASSFARSQTYIRYVHTRVLERESERDMLSG